MISKMTKTENAGSRTCTCCGTEIRPIDGPQRLLAVLNQRLRHQRAFQCINCGQMTCLQCSGRGRQCTCNTNARVAKPVLALNAI